MAFRKRIIILVLALVLTFLMGIIGYEWIEGWNFLDSAFMTVITLGTIGYGETHPLSDHGRIFTIFLILSSLSTVSYGALTLTSLVADGELIRLLKRKRMDKAIAKLQEHYLVCGAGKTGEHIIEELMRTGREVVAIDRDPANLRVFHSRESIRAHFGEEFNRCQVYYIEGDASQDQILLEAGIQHAEGIFCALPTDKDNLFVVLTARSLNSKIRIVSKCQDEDSEPKLMRAGADRIVSVNRIGGLRMASEMIRPTVVSFLDLMVRDPRGYRFEEITIQNQSPYVGKTIRQSPFGSDPEIRVVTLAVEAGQYHYNPPEDTVLVAGQRVVVLARSEQVERLRQTVNHRA